MLLGEALAERASRKKQLEQVEARAASVARYQEGEQPAENAEELLEKGRRLTMARVRLGATPAGPGTNETAPSGWLTEWARHPA